VNHTRLRRVLTTAWAAGAAAALYLYFVHGADVERLLGDATAASFIAGGAVYLALGCLRGFTLIPVTSLVLLGVVFFPPVPLFVLTLAGILVSSASVYYFAEALHVDELLREKHRDRLDHVQRLLERHGLPIIVCWSFFPLVPTDLICYLSGVLRIRVMTCLMGVALGEGAICAIYIFLGDSLLRTLGVRV
jgi:uncharacterized membrane protein YdjX (TVP38/TMEM64 family)